MATFAYKARDERGLLVQGNIEAATQREAMMQLDSMGYIPVSAKETGRSGSSSVDDFMLRFQRVKFDDLIFFTRQLRTVVRSAIPIVTGLRALAEQTTNPRLQKAVVAVSQDIDKGLSFSDALSKHKGVFSEIYVAMVRSGETSGNLEETLDRLSDLLEFQMKTRETIKSAMRYPVFVVITLISAFIVLVNVVVPKFAPLFKSAKIALPLPTQILLIINDIFQNYLGISLAILAALVVAFILYKRTEAGKYAIDVLKLKIPLIGDVILKTCMSRFAFTLENLVSSGVPILRTLDIVSRTVGNEFIAKKVLDISENIEKGHGIARPLKEAKIFPALVIHLISTGEETGALEDMLREISTHYDREVTYTVNRLSAYIEPILTVGLAGMVLFLALAIFMPWWNIMSAMRGAG
ncbi:MAG: type II secretion system F family protein [Syntrophorhabdaceae bacterium]|nr:type II secretion system F family protein [Syntrophorhabdaceae bacterium]MDD4194874.1 type II secretion system F family protein [Syntrophorhabdaceae bacterium]